MVELLLGAGITITVIILLLLYLYGTSILTISFAEFRMVWSVTRRLRQNGVLNFFAQRSDYIKYRKNGTIPEYIDTVRRELIYIGFWLAHGMEMSNLRDKLTELVKRGCYVELIFVDPESQYIVPLADYLATTPEDLRRRVEQTIQQMREIGQLLSQEERNRFTVKTHRKLMTSSAFILDYHTNRARILVDFKLYSAGRDKTFGLEFQTVKSRDSLFSRLAESLMRIRESSIPLSSNETNQKPRLPESNSDQR